MNKEVEIEKGFVDRDEETVSRLVSDLKHVGSFGMEKGSALVGATLGESDLRKRWGVGVVAVRRGDQFFPNPDSDFRLEAEDELVVLGGRAGLESLEGSVKG